MSCLVLSHCLAYSHDSPRRITRLFNIVFAKLLHTIYTLVFEPGSLHDILYCTLTESWHGTQWRIGFATSWPCENSMESPKAESDRVATVSQPQTNREGEYLSEMKPG